MNKKNFIVILVGLFILAFSTSVFAWAPELNGKPEAFQPGESRGYFIWHNNDGFHLRTTTRGHSHVFSGVLRTDGRFVDVHGAHLETDDAYLVGHERHQIKFRFDTAGGADGIDFRVAGGDKVVFDLFVDGHQISPNEIYGGFDGWHPDDNRFEVFR